MWLKILEEGTIDWDDILKKPTEFPPKNHLHKEYAKNIFLHEGKEYELQDVVSQIVIFLKTELNFILQ